MKLLIISSFQDLKFGLLKEKIMLQMIKETDTDYKIEKKNAELQNNICMICTKSAAN